LTEPQLSALIARIEKACEETGAHCKITIEKKPRLEHVHIEINAKVDAGSAGKR